MTWELPQSLVSGFAGLIAVLFWQVKQIRSYEGVLIIVGRRKRRYWGGISFGSLILLDENGTAEVGNQLFMHEFGHSLQSRLSGPLYLVKYGLPSLWSALRFQDLHYLHPVEQDANSRAHDWFCHCHGWKGWADARFPRCQHQQRLPLKWWEYLPVIFPFYHLLKAWKFHKAQKASVLR